MLQTQSVEGYLESTVPSRSLAVYARCVSVPRRETEDSDQGTLRNKYAFHAVSPSAGGWQIFSDYPGEESEAGVGGGAGRGFVRFPTVRQGGGKYSRIIFGEESEAGVDGGPVEGFVRFSTV